MKKLMLFIMLALAPIATHAESSVFDKFKICTALAVQYTALAQIALISEDSDESKFKDYLKKQAEVRHDKSLVPLGDLAWASRGVESPQTGALKLYDICISKTGSSA